MIGHITGGQTNVNKKIFRQGHEKLSFNTLLPLPFIRSGV
jgi:hypothetical protein